MGKEYLYEIGQVVNETLQIVEQIRVKCGKYTQKGYLVKSLTFPDDKNDYEMRETNLKRGQGCAYLRGLRVCPKNSLWSVESVRDNIIDVEQAKNTSRMSSDRILFQCDDKDCDYVKEKTVYNLVENGFCCPICSINTSYPELHFTGYNGAKESGFIPQQRFDDFPNHIFDFVNYERRIIVETHGLAHYEEVSSGSAWKDAHKRTVASDKRKRKYCKDNNWTLIELDCRKSSFEFIRNSIANEPLLEDIADDEVTSMLKIMENNKRYPVKKIIRLYTVEMLTTVEIGKQFGFNSSLINRILHNNNIKLRDGGGTKKKVRCITTGEVFESATKGAEMYNIKSIGNISASINPNSPRKSAGTLEDGTKLHWEFVTEENELIA